MKRNLFRKITGLTLAAMVALALPIQALAEEYDLNVGSVTVTADDSGRYVQQQNNTAINNSDNGGRGHKETTATVITSKPTDNCTQKAEGTNNSNTITIQSEGKAKAEVTIKDVNIATNNGSGINVTDGSKAEVTVKGENTVTTTSYYNAAVHVDSGELTITGGREDKLTANSHIDGAGIGSNYQEAMTGKIAIQGDLTVDASSMSGAGIGSGFHGAMTDGSISIQDNAQVTANSYDGAGIGSGNHGTMDGTITIGGNTEVTAGSGMGASIGAGRPGYYARGGNFQEGASIEIKDNAEVTINQPEGGKKIGATSTDKSSGDFSIDPTAKLDGQTITDPTVLVDNYGLNAEQIKKPTPPEPTPEPMPEPTPEPTPPARSLYWVTDGNGQGVAVKEERQDDTLTVTVELETASFVTTQWGLGELGKQGVQTITFVTSGATSSFDLAEALANLDSGNLVLTHGDSNASLTLDGVEHNELLK